jgi:putative ABC transport system ATP-binding protein
MLTVSHLSKTFSSGDTAVTAVDDISFEVDKAQFVAIIGRSGSGKSTLMGLLGALDNPTGGTITVDGKIITGLKDQAQTHYRGKEIGFVFQGYNLVPNLTALENVLLAMETGVIPRANQRSRAEHLLEEVGLPADKQRRKPSRLSGGEQQRVAIARALANRPKLILADEPTGNLDSRTSDVIVELLRSLCSSEQTTIIVVTHDPALAQQADKVFELRDGKLVGSKNRRQA